MTALAQLIRKVRRTVLNEDPSFCDLYADAGARGFGAEYLGVIEERLSWQFGEARLTIIDAGCQAGRLLIPLGRRGHTMIGIEPSGFALRRAKAHMAAHGVAGRLHCGDALHVRRWVPESSVDAVLCAEVLYLCPNYREILGELIKTLRPGGVSFVSYRTTQYYVHRMLVSQGIDAALDLAARREGPTTEGAYFNWHTEASLQALYRSLGLHWLSAHPVMREQVTVDPQALRRPELARLFAGAAPDGRYELAHYLLVCAQRPAAVAVSK